MEALQFPRGNYYQIICKAGDYALQVQQTDPSKFDKSRIVGAQSNPNNNFQIFMVEKVNQNDDGFEIVSCPTALVFDEEGKQIRLRSGKQSKDQLFSLVPAPVQAFHKYYWIKTDSKGKEALSLEGILRYEAHDANKESQLFRIQLVNNPAIQTSAVIINNASGKALDVPGATTKKGERIVQWELNKRWNQRWRFVRQNNRVAIQNVFNGLFLDIAEQSRENKAKVVQWDQTGGSNQGWIPEKNGNLYRFRSAHEGSLFLSIKGQDVGDGGKLEVSNQESPSIYWRIEGAQP